MAENKRFFLDEVMDANDAELTKAMPGYRFSSGRWFFGENDIPGPFKYATDGNAKMVDDTVVTQLLGIFQGSPWLDTVGAWDDTQRWID